MLKAAVLGATGYVGAELVRLLCSHDSVELTALFSKNYGGRHIAELYPSFAQHALPTLAPLDDAALGEIDADIVFMALPHGVSAATAAKLFAAGKRVIDLSADLRYDDPAVYARWYDIEHPAPELLVSSVYGLCELHREKIKRAQLVGNPGCYTTCSILALAPLVKRGLIDINSIIIDAKSGASGAGRELSLGTHFCELDENLRAYSVGTHRHTSEIEQELSKLCAKALTLSFTPHVLPMKRGILATCYAKLTKKLSKDELLERYKAFYANEPFVKLFETALPEPKHVNGSNNVAIGMAVDERTGRIVVVACIDNLIKGAAGQAVQNMNIMFGADETSGLTALPYYL